MSLTKGTLYFSDAQIKKKKKQKEKEKRKLNRFAFMQTYKC